jgi:hypothetical protein
LERLPEREAVFILRIHRIALFESPAKVGIHCEGAFIFVPSRILCGVAARQARIEVIYGYWLFGFYPGFVII